MKKTLFSIRATLFKEHLLAIEMKEKADTYE